MAAEEQHEFRAEWDEEGVYFYQAYCDDIADYAIREQKFGGPLFKPLRMTWIKPSLAWALYRSGYARKHNQQRLLKIKLSHRTVAEILDRCSHGVGGGGGSGRVQWDPARDLHSAEKGGVPRKLLRERAIQIGVKGELSKLYVDRVLSIEDKTELAHQIQQAHQAKSPAVPMADLLAQLPNERPYHPLCHQHTFIRLALKKISN